MAEVFDSITINIKASKSREFWERRRDVLDVIIGDRKDFKIGEFGDFRRDIFDFIVVHFKGAKSMDLDDFKGEVFEFVAGEIKDVENILHFKDPNRDPYKVIVDLCDGIIAGRVSIGIVCLWVCGI